ncbi:SDR family NAD(P)-dependent oxidoreductase [Pseudoteredinibacter isoporae]|uniref:SDR family NAD(P)-dependent oxidoreductase n=1 Tax=Pseudoteredinibacter isoporae TaxID=570281 RepID=UPI00333F905D
MDLLVVSGASGSLGVALLRQALGQGYAVLALVRNEQSAEKLSATISHEQLHMAVVDFALPDCAETLWGAIHKVRFGSLNTSDIAKVSLVFNAACYPPGGTAKSPARELQAWRHVMTVNAFSVDLCLSKLSPLVEQGVLTSVLGVSSLSAYVGLPGDACYAGSKSTLERIIESYALDWRDKPVSMGLLIPSSFASNLQREASSGGASATSAAKVADSALSALAEGLKKFRYPADPAAEKVLAELSSVKREHLLTLVQGYC